MEEPIENEELDAQEEVIEGAGVKRKQHFAGKVARLTLGGALVDLGLEKPGILHISQISTEPINRIEDKLQVGQTVDVWVRRIDKTTGTVELTMIKPLGLEWREIKKGMSVTGKIIRIERYGVFVEIGAERPGMVHVSELSHDFVRNPYEAVHMDEEIEVQVVDFDRRKKQIRLSRKALLDKPAPPEEEIVIPAQYEPEVEEVDDKPVPTAMEMAFRAAQKRSKDAAKSARKEQGKKNRELEDIFSRTLQGYKSEK